MSNARSSYEPHQLPTGLGCFLVFPTAMFGTVMLTDEQGAHGRHLLAEFFGWWTLCIGVSLVCSWVLAKFYAKGRRRFLYLLAGGAVAAGFLLLTIAEAHPDTPAIVKDFATASLQPLGAVGIVGLVLLLSRVRGSSYRS